MAQIHTGRNELKDQYEKKKQARQFPGRFLLIGLIAVCSVALLFAVANPSGLRHWIAASYWSMVPEDGFLSLLIQLIMTMGQPLIFVLWVGTYILLIYVIFKCISLLRSGNYGVKTNEEAILEAGLAGQDRILELLKRLPDWCHVYTGVTVPWRDGRGKQKSSNTDMILVSPCGIHVIKVKNQKGTVCGQTDDQNLIQKVYRGGKIFRETPFYNPIQQVKTHARGLTAYLREQGMKWTVNPCVFFSHEEVELDIKGNTDSRSACPVFTSDMYWDFRDYACHKYGRVYSDKDVQEILTALDRLLEQP